MTDPDAQDDLAKLNQMLDEYEKTQSTFEAYAAEVRSGHLRWTPAHKSETFWRENAKRIVEEGKGELVRELAEVMGKEWEGDKSVLAVGCNDVGWLVKCCPEKKRVLEEMGLKKRVMELMGSGDEAVRYEGLRAVGEWLRYSIDA